MRTFDAHLVYGAIKALLKCEPHFDVIEWVAEPHNIALLNEVGDLALFERGKNPLTVTGHYYFLSRGKDAIRTAREFLSDVFDLGVQTITGITPLTNLGARWMSRHLGFKSYGVVKTTEEPFELFIMHHTEYKR